MKFKIGNRVQLTKEALEACNPAISDQGMRGTIKGLEPEGDLLLIEFDDDVAVAEWCHNAGQFKLEVTEKTRTRSKKDHTQNLRVETLAKIKPRPSSDGSTPESLEETT